MAGPHKDERSPMSVAMQWASQVTTVAFEMALPAALGYWLDQRWGTEPWLVIVGAVLGLIAAFTHLLQMASAANRNTDSNKRISN